MVTLRACRCHNCGVGNGGAVVAADSAREAGGDTDELKGIARLEHAEDDGNKDSEGTPAGSGRKGDKASNEEDNCGEESGERASVCHNALYELVASEKACGVLKCVSKGKNENRGNHCVEALRQSLHGVLKAHMTASDHINDDQHQGDKTAPRETDSGVGVTECADEIHIVFALSVEEAADVHKSQYGDHDKEDNGDKNIKDACALVDVLVNLVGSHLAKLTVLSLDLKLGHFAIVEAHNCQTDDEYESKERIEVEGDRSYEKLKSRHISRNLGGHVTGDSRRPGGDRSDHAYGSRGRVDNVGKLCS